MRDFKNNHGIVQLLKPQDLAHNDTASSWLDTRYFNAAMIGVMVGALTGVDASNYVTPILQESDTTADADATTVDSSDQHGAFTKIDATTEDQVTQVVGYKGSKRYIRAKLDYTGTGISAGIVGVFGILGKPAVAPAVANAAVAAT